MPDVTLYVDSRLDGYKHVSDVRIYTESDDSFHPVSPAYENGLSVRYDLGPLDPLTKCYLLVNTAVRRGSDLSGPEIIYRIDYGDTHIQKEVQHSKFDEVGFAFFNFHFRFCPRFPFC